MTTPLKQKQKKIELDKETLIRGRSKHFKGCCAIEEVSTAINI